MCSKRDDINNLLVKGALPLLALTGTTLEALWGGIGIVLSMLFTVVLVRLGRLMAPVVANPLLIVVAAATAATVTSSIIALGKPFHMETLAFYLPVMALSSLLLTAAISSQDGGLGEMVMRTAKAGANLFVFMLLLGVLREVLGRGQFLGYGNIEAPLHVLGLAPGAFFLTGGLMAVVRWATTTASAPASHQRPQELSESVGR